MSADTDTAVVTATGPRRARAGISVLVRAELRRLAWRRVSWLGAVAALALLGLSLFGMWSSTQPPSPAERTQQEQAYQDAVRTYPEQLASCRQAAAAARSNGDTRANFECDRMPEPRREMFGPTPATFLGLLPEAARSTAYTLSFLAFVVGASFVAAEFATGSMGTWLTFEPRRLPVAASKLAAVGLGLLVAVTLLFAVTAAGVWLVCVLNATGAPGPGTPVSSVVWLVLRGVVMATAAGIGGAALALIARGTGAVIAIVVGYAIGVEGVIASRWQNLQPWLVRLNVRGWLEGSATYYIQSCGTDQQGQYSCTGVKHILTLGHATAYLGVLGALVLVLALWTFRRRDLS